MKKLFITTLMVLSLMVLPFTAIAGGHYSDSAVAGAGNIEADLTVVPFVGAAGGIAGAGGIGAAQSAGVITWGSVGGDVSAVGGGLTSTDSGILWFPNGFFSIGVYSQSSAEAVTGASGIIDVSGLLGAGETTIGGVAGQFTLDGSFVTLTPLHKSDGFTGGIAGQGAAGAFVGGAVIGTFIGSADAETSALIDMWGGSGSSSYMYTKYDWGSGALTEGMRTDVYAYTGVESSQIAEAGGCFLAGGYAVVDGGWVAAGGASTLTVQTNEYGGAKAMATGSYSGHGDLGSNYGGSAVGYSQTSITTYKGVNGSINSASSGMHVTSGPSLD